jgi:uncharacterized protein
MRSLFIGFSPTLGFQMALAVFLASILKWNKLSAVISVWISNPITAPILYGVTYITGAKVMGISHASIPFNELSFPVVLTLLKKTPVIIWAMTIGGVIIGLPLAILSYYLVYSAVNAYQEDIRKKLSKKKDFLAKQKNKLSVTGRRKKKKKKKK